MALAAGQVLAYVRATKQDISHIDRFTPFNVTDAMMLDAAALGSLEVFASTNVPAGDTNRVRTLYDALNLTRSAPGKRLLRSWLQRPLIDKAQIKGRLDAVELFYRDKRLREVVRKLLGQVQDLERTATRLAAKKSGPRDLKAMEHTLSVIPELKTAMVEHEAVHSWLKARRGLVEEIAGKIRAAIKDDAPTKADRQLHPKWLRRGAGRAQEARRRGASVVHGTRGGGARKTGISTLRVGSNAALGIYFETPKQPGSKVPGDWEQVHELKDKRRYTRADLRKRYAEQQDAGEQARTRELKLLAALVENLQPHVESLKLLSKMIARIDVYASFAEVAAVFKYIRPQVGTDTLQASKGDGIRWSSGR